MALKFHQQLKEVGSKLETPPTNKDSLIKLLKQAATCLCELDQSPPKPILESIQPFLNAIVKPELVKHQDREVKLLVATCVCEITRITAPEAPYSDDVLKDIFQLIVSTFSGLSDTNGPSFGRRVVILETLARYRSCVVMLDLECDDLVHEMFRTFFSVASDDHPEGVLTSMQTIMVVLLEESEEVQEDLLLVLLSVLGRNNNDFTMAARRLAMNVIEQCAVKLEPGIKQVLISSMSGDRSGKNQIDYHEVIYDIYRCASHILSDIVPYLTEELLTDQLDIRVKAVKLVGDLFALPGSSIPETFQPIFLEFLKRLTDRVVEVRMSVLEHVKNYLLLNPSRAEAPQIVAALCDRLLDYDEHVRKQVVSVVCDVSCQSLTSIPVDTVKLVAERLRDKSLLVKRYTMERLADIYRLYCLSRSDGSVENDDFDWVPGKLLRCFYDKDFRSDTIEPILCGSLFPTEFSIKDKVKYWVKVFSRFEKVEIKALEKILEQKQRFQQEMQRYLSLRQIHQDNDAPETQKKILFCFRVMSHCFADPAKAEENFQILDQLKDVNVWKILTTLLDPNTSSIQAYSCRDDLLKILGEKHRLYEFLSTLSIKCAYLIFNKEHVNEILLETDIHKSAGSTQYIVACMNILVTLARFSPLLLSGIEEELVHLLKDDNEIIKEGVLHVLAKAGGTIREQLGVSSSSLDLILERLCLEGSRKQAKYAVHALAAITKDDGLKSLSVLYKRLVGMLKEKTHLPAVLQSLGCIAQTALPVFETRESEVEGLIKKDILESSDKANDKSKERWEERSELCSLKIFGIKTLVKSYLPVKDAHLRLGIDGLIGILRNILAFGELSKDIESSSVDKAHLRLAAAKAILCLSKHWDHKIPFDVFYLTLRTSEIEFPQAKRLFLNKVHQYVKDRLLDPKYACAFIFDIIGSGQPDFEEDKQNLVDIVQMCQQGKSRQLSLQSDASSSFIYPEFILPYLIHALAHHSSCPNVDECKDVKAFELIYRQMHLILSMLVHGDEDAKSDLSVNQQKDGIPLIISILQTIKRSEDAVDPVKSKNSHAICDLGLSITKRLVQKHDGLQDLNVPASLPPILYKPCEKQGEGDNQIGEGQTWLANEEVLSHFDSLKLEANGTVYSEGVGEEGLKDSEVDGNDVPLGKMMKHLKAKGTKSRKVVKSSESPQAGMNDVDILDMVREINLDNLGKPSKFESSNGHDNSTKTSKRDVQKQKKKRVATDSTDVPVAKQRRSSSALGAYKFSPPRSTLKGKISSADKLPQAGVSSFESTEMDEDQPCSEDKVTVQEDMGEPAGSDLLVSWKNSGFSSKHKLKSYNNDKAHEIGEADDHDLKEPNILMKGDNKKGSHSSKIPTASVKKRKRRSIAGLAKCTTKDGRDNTKELIGCRIKVWWPMDKQFYEGVVKSFDTQKNKHLILYEDGDVEVLRLEKERWELVDNGRKPIKPSKASKGPVPNASLSEPVKKTSGGSQKNKRLTKISSLSDAKGKRTPRKKLNQRLKDVFKSKASSEFGEASEGGPGMSDPEEATTSKLDDANSGESEDRIKTSETNNLTDGEESDKDETMVSDEKQLTDSASSPSDADEPMQGTPKSAAPSVPDDDDDDDDAEGSDEEDASEEKTQGKQGQTSTEDVEEPMQETPKSATPSVPDDDDGAEGSDEEDASEEKAQGKQGQTSREEISADSQDNKQDDGAESNDQKKSEEKSSASSSDSGEAEISDDETLSTWKHRVCGK